MANETIGEAGTQPDKIEFIEFHQPGLKGGQYAITVSQQIHSNETGQQKIPITTFTSPAKTFIVSGERFDLKPADIYAVFPPDGSLGEHSNVLPHMILNRSTLPWERMADESREEIPWMALLLFDSEESLGGVIQKQDFIAKYNASNAPSPSGEEVWNHLLDQTVGWLKIKDNKTDKAAIRARERRAAQTLAGEFTGLESRVEAVLDQARSPKVLTLGDLLTPSNDMLKWPGVEIENGQQHVEDKVSVIEVEKSLLEKILPTEDELALLTHVRQGKDSSRQLIGDELVVIIGNRLPRAGAISNVHLISVEGRYANGAFDYQGADDDDLIRLVSLKNWSFACVDEKQSFKGLLKNLDLSPSTLQLKQEHEFTEAEKYMVSGSVPVPHYLRQGSKTVSWYHGPLIPGENMSDMKLPVRAADELVRYSPSTGMFDISYAAAWELGRLLALQSKQVSVGLYNWKRTHAQYLKREEQRLLHNHLPVGVQTVEAGDGLPGNVAAWFDSLSLLQGIPFNYLVPDERMLQQESLRFFWLDHLWVDCLLDGAFSIGRVTASDYRQDEQRDDGANAYEKVTGFLLRSDVVSGWPGLLVDAFDQIDRAASGKQLKLLRMERLSRNVLLCLFEGEAKRVEIHQKPEALHFGFDKPETGDYRGFYKTLRDDEGNPIHSPNISSIPWRQDVERVVNIGDLARAIKQGLNSAGFALQMIEGVEKVIFNAG